MDICRTVRIDVMMMEWVVFGCSGDDGGGEGIDDMCIVYIPLWLRGWDDS